MTDNQFKLLIIELNEVIKLLRILFFLNAMIAVMLFLVLHRLISQL